MGDQVGDRAGLLWRDGGGRAGVGAAAIGELVAVAECAADLMNEANRAAEGAGDVDGATVGLGELGGDPGPECFDVCGIQAASCTMLACLFRSAGCGESCAR
jgi:hypothetical protein